jgi:signal peptidase II
LWNEISKRLLFFLIIAIPVVLLDQICKIFIEHSFFLHESVEIIPGFLNIVSVRNRGAAFGILRDHNSVVGIPIFLVIAFIAIVVIFYIYMREDEAFLWRRVGLCFILSGTFGNLIDRIRLGEVIDFIDIYVKSYHWPAFNVADSAITTGAVLIIVSLTFQAPSSQK